MFRVISNTSNYKKVVLYETNQIKVEYVTDKIDSYLDRIRIIKLGNYHVEPKCIVVYRYEDEQFVNDTLALHGYKEL